MASSYFLGILCFVTSCFLFTRGSLIDFTSSGNFTSMLTNSLTLRCYLNETSGNAVVGRRRRDVDKTDENVHPSAMFITRNNGEQVASMTQFSPATSLLNDPNIHVTGKFEGSPVTKGSLIVRWDGPTKTEAGDYKCEVSTITNRGRGITFSKMVSVDAKSPTIDGLVKYVHDMEINYRQQMSDLKAEFQQSGTQINRLKHIETGLIECGDSRKPGWTSGATYTGDGGLVINKTTTFAQDYFSTPVVFISIIEQDYWQKSSTEKGVQYGVSLQTVSSHNFVVRCYVDNDSGDLQRLRASWISFPN